MKSMGNFKFRELLAVLECTMIICLVFRFVYGLQQLLYPTKSENKRTRDAMYVRGSPRVKLNTFACFSMKTQSVGTH